MRRWGKPETGKEGERKRERRDKEKGRGGEGNIFRFRTGGEKKKGEEANRRDRRGEGGAVRAWEKILILS